MFNYYTTCLLEVHRHFGFQQLYIPTCHVIVLAYVKFESSLLPPWLPLVGYYYTTVLLYGLAVGFRQNIYITCTTPYVGTAIAVRPSAAITVLTVTWTWCSFFLVQAYLCNLRAYIISSDAERPIQTLQVYEKTAKVLDYFAMASVYGR